MRETLGLQPGLIVVRYKKSPGGQNAIIRPTLADPASRAAQIVADPLKRDAVLESPGDCFVVRCTAPARLHIDITSAIPGQQARGSVTVEYLTSQQLSSAAQAGGGAQMAPASALPNQAPEAATLRYVGHVSYWGDVHAQHGEWIGGPDRPMPIEGVMVDAQSAGAQGIRLKDVQTGRIAQAGEFLGSRGQSNPLRGVEIWLEGQNDGTELHVEALFRDAGRIEKRGRFVAMVGASLSDVLLGLRISLASSPLQTHGSAPFGGQTPYGTPPPEQPRMSGAPERRERSKIFRR